MKSAIALVAILAMFISASAVEPKTVVFGLEDVQLISGNSVTDDEIEIRYDDDPANAITVNQYPLTFAVRFTSPVNGTLKAIRYFQPDIPFPTTDIRIYESTGSPLRPGPVIYRRDYEPEETGWQLIPVDANIPVTFNRDFWVGVFMDRYPPTPRIGCDAGPSVMWRSYVEWAGSWFEMGSLGAAVNINLRAIAEIAGGIEEEFSPGDALSSHSLRPNPIRDGGRVSYQVRQPGRVSLEIFDAVGAKVRTLADEYTQPGESSVYWDRLDDFGRRVSAGIYLYRLSVDEQNVTGRVVVLD